MHDLIKIYIYMQYLTVYIDEVVPNLMVLLYADDLVQCADLPGRLQSQLNVLADFCEKWGMTVSFDKTNVFRNGGIIKRNELWYFKGQQLRPANYYKYLGLVIKVNLDKGSADTGQSGN